MLADEEVTYPDGRPAIRIYIMSDRFNPEVAIYKRISSGFAGSKATFLTGLTAAHPSFEGAELNIVTTGTEAAVFSENTKAIVDGTTVRVYATTAGPSVIYVGYNIKGEVTEEKPKEKTAVEIAAEEKAKKDAEAAAGKRLLRYLSDGGTATEGTTTDETTTTTDETTTEETTVTPEEDGSIKGIDSAKTYQEVIASAGVKNGWSSGKGSAFKDAEAVTLITDLEGHKEYEFFVVAGSAWPTTYAELDGKYTKT